MIKNAELANENSCLNRAEADEPIFVLKSTDELAASIVRTWAIMYFKIKSAQPMGMTPKQRAKYEEAMVLAAAMDQWHAEYRKRAGEPEQSPKLMAYAHRSATERPKPPSDAPLSAHETISQLCRMQADLYEALPEVGAADCFCGEGGFWGVGDYDGTFDTGYRNDGKALAFIDEAIQEKLARMRSIVASETGVAELRSEADRLGINIAPVK